jgi:hypothetical protein
MANPNPAAHQAHEFPLADRLVLGEVRSWLKTAFDTARAGCGDMNEVERARQKMIDELQHLHLSGADYTIVPRILGALRRAQLLRDREPARRPEPGRRDPAEAYVATCDLGYCDSDTATVILFDEGWLSACRECAARILADEE